MARKTPVPAQPVVQSEEEAAQHAQRFVEEDLIVKKLEVDKANEKAALDAKYEKLMRPHVQARDEHFGFAHAWAEANRHGRKSIKLLNERMLRWSFASNSKLIVLGKLPTIVRLLLRFENWSKYLDIELKKNNIKADLEVLRKVPGLRRAFQVERPEYFHIS